MVSIIPTFLTSADSKTLAEQWVINGTTLLMFVTGEYADIPSKTTEDHPSVLSTKVKDKTNSSSKYFSLNYILILETIVITDDNELAKNS
jgi:hypothetical protein